MSASFDDLPQTEEVSFESYALLAYSPPRGHGFFSILEGFAKVELTFAGRTKTIQILCPGSVFPSFPPDGKLTVTALSRLRTRFHTHHALMANGVPHEACASLFSHIEESYMKLAIRLWILESRSVRARVAGTLLGLKAREASSERRRAPPVVSVDRKTLAEIAGTASETLSRVLTELEEDSTIRRSGRSIAIVDESKLLELAATY